MLHNPSANTYACPGSGTQQLVELSAYVKHQDGYTPGNLRVAIYDTSKNLIAQGNAEVLVSDTTLGWKGHIGAANIDPNPCNLTGGVSYIFAFTRDSAYTYDYYRTLTSGTLYATSADYTGGFPDPITVSTSLGRSYSVRGGVEAAAAGQPTIKRWGGVPGMAINRGVW